MTIADFGRARFYIERDPTAIGVNPQFTIYDDRKSVENIETVYDAIKGAFHAPLRDAHRPANRSFDFLRFAMSIGGRWPPAPIPSTWIISNTRSS